MTTLTYEKAKELVAQYGSQRAAAEGGEVSLGKLQRALRKGDRRRAAREGLPEGYVRRGVSTLRDGQGGIMQEWDKSRMEGMDEEDVVRIPEPRHIKKVSTMRDAEGLCIVQWIGEEPKAAAIERSWELFAEKLAESIPKVPKIFLSIDAEPTRVDLLTVYPVSDHHLGMLAWDKEVGDDWDLDIASEILDKAVQNLVTAAPRSQRALIAFMGDFLHYDSFETVTPAHRNQLDSDTRFPKMIEAGVRLMRRTIDLALMGHEQVHVIVETGNHDPASTAFLALCLKVAYENNERVTIDRSPQHYHYYRFGRVLIGTHHGHGTPMKNLPLIMAADRAEDWGATYHRHWLTGHIHHAKTQAAMSAQDFTGCTVESFRTLPPEDAWAHQKGFRAKRDMKAIIYHAQWGEVARHTVTPDMFR